MDRMDDIMTVKEAVKEVLGWPDRWYRVIVREVNGQCPPPTYTLPGAKRKHVKPRELKEWWEARIAD